jgi:hypothetical protein
MFNFLLKYPLKGKTIFRFKLRTKTSRHLNRSV